MQFSDLNTHIIIYFGILLVLSPKKPKPNQPTSQKPQGDKTEEETNLTLQPDHAAKSSRKKTQCLHFNFDHPSSIVPPFLPTNKDDSF